jgi:hypothetical protein
LAQLGKSIAARRRDASSAWLGVSCWALSACAGEISGSSGTGVHPSESDRREVEHWSFEVPSTVEPPSFDGPAWVINEIDAFVGSQLAALGRSPAPPASPAKLVRRVTLTLTGLLPSLEEVDAFEADPSDEAYRALVERLLASPRYAEHMASTWLDLARYADTDGFQYDQTRNVWPWRDWVLQAFDTNMPFDQFTLATRLWDTHGPEPEAAMRAGFRLLTSRAPDEAELAILEEVYAAQLELASREGVASRRLQSTGRSAPSSEAPEQVALTQVVRVLFNLSETMTQE